MNGRHALVFLIAAIAAILLLSACSLAGDVTPPPGGGALPTAAAPTEPAAPPADSGLGYSAQLPSAANGAVVYAAHCIRCHGAAGRGDGELAGQLQFPPANFTDPALAHSATPAGWFQMVTEGNLDRFMPPFGEALSEADRWDVISYLFALGAPPEEVEAGREVYEANCAACHGETGRGDGPDAPAGSSMPDLSDLQRMAGLSQIDLFNVITSGAGEAMPAFGESLTEEERWAAAAYVRTFSYDYLAPGAEPTESLGVVTGNVINRTTGEPVTENLNVVLYGFSDVQLATTITETLQADGSYLFENVPYVPGRSFVVTVEYAGALYGSEIAAFEGGTGRLDAPINIYEPTTDTAALRLDQMHVFFDFSGDQLVVGELWTISNSGIRTVLGGEALSFDLPPGATDLRIEGLAEGDAYLTTPTGFMLNRPILPGDNAAQLLLSFSMPFERRLDFTQPLPFPVSVASVLVPDGSLRLAGDQLQSDGPRSIEGAVFQSYSAANLPAGGVLAFTLSGQGGSPSFLALEPGDLVVGGLALALALGWVGWWYYSRKQTRAVAGARPQAGQASLDSLLQTVAELDDDREAGKIGRAEYERTRAALKDQIVRAMRSND